MRNKRTKRTKRTKRKTQKRKYREKPILEVYKELILFYKKP